MTPGLPREGESCHVSAREHYHCCARWVHCLLCSLPSDHPLLRVGRRAQPVPKLVPHQDEKATNADKGFTYPQPAPLLRAPVTASSSGRLGHWQTLRLPLLLRPIPGVGDPLRLPLRRRRLLPPPRLIDPGESFPARRGPDPLLSLLYRIGCSFAVPFVGRMLCTTAMWLLTTFQRLCEGTSFSGLNPHGHLMICPFPRI
jgi:hypothetical protein